MRIITHYIIALPWFRTFMWQKWVCYHLQTLLLKFGPITPTCRSTCMTPLLRDEWHQTFLLVHHSVTSMLCYWQKLGTKLLMNGLWPEFRKPMQVQFLVEHHVPSSSIHSPSISTIFGNKQVHPSYEIFNLYFSYHRHCLLSAALY